MTHGKESMERKAKHEFMRSCMEGDFLKVGIIMTKRKGKERVSL